MDPGGPEAARRRAWPKRSFGALLAACVVVGVAFAALAWHAPIAKRPPATRAEFAQAEIDRGARLAAIANCAGCHTRRDGAPFAGGLPMHSAFGTLYTANITPAPVEGIGGWSREAFARAMRDGVSRDGHLLYPAFPYDHFTGVDDPDLDALFAFFATRTPSESRPPVNDMHFPFGWRPLLAGWNLLFLRHRAPHPDPAQGAEWNRGAYLADALAHCSACHSPRNFLGAERRDQAFAGGQPEGWYAPPLNAASPSPQPWTVPALTRYLRTGIAPLHAMAGGPMQGVTAALGQADAGDVEAIATYVVSLMAPVSAQGRERAPTSLARADSPLAASAPASDDPLLALGARVYATACAACHDPGRGESSNAALRLPLAVAVHDADPHSLLRIVRAGITPPDGSPGRSMPAFGSALTDEQLLALAAYLRKTAAQAPAWSDLDQAVKDTREPSSSPPREASP